MSLKTNPTPGERGSLRFLRPHNSKRLVFLIAALSIYCVRAEVIVGPLGFVAGPVEVGRLAELPITAHVIGLPNSGSSALSVTNLNKTLNQPGLSNSLTIQATVSNNFQSPSKVQPASPNTSIANGFGPNSVRQSTSASTANARKIIPILMMLLDDEINIAPIANAGPTQTLSTGSLVQLDGRASSDTNGDNLIYSWSITSKPIGSNAVLNFSSNPTPSFKADKAGNYSFQLQVSDGQLSSTSNVNITAAFSTSVTLSSAGIYSSNLEYPSVANFHNQINLPNGRKGLIFTGWQYQNGSNLTHKDVDIVLMEQDANGLMRIATDQYLSNKTTAGGNSIIVADFNGDGRDDIFLPALNESPMTGQPSTFYQSNATGTFDRKVLSDNVIAHGAALYTYNGKPTVFTGSFVVQGNEDRNPVYQHQNGQMQVIGHITNVNANMSYAAADLNGDGKLEGLGGGDRGIHIFDLEGGLGQAPFFGYEVLPMYLTDQDTITYNSGPPHQYRIWLEDFNHDGQIDILAGQSLWTQAHNNYPNVLQVLQNNGNLQFLDRTDALNPDMNRMSEEVEYSMQMLDIDNSGINSLLTGWQHPGTQWGGALSRQSNYLLLNDGTGRLHVGLHSEFADIAQKIRPRINYLNEWDGANAGKWWNGTQWLDTTAEQFGVPQFVGYLNPDNSLNYVARYYQTFINVPLYYSPTTDFIQSISIADRNNSQKIRTFAGNDTITDTGQNNQTTTIDGGLGIDTCIYSAPRSQYQITSQAEYTRITHTPSGKIDLLKNIEILRFSDHEVAIH